MVLVVLGVSMLTFFLMHLTPGEPAIVILKNIFLGEIEAEPTEEEIRIITERFNLGAPQYIQYFGWLSRILHGDLGTSYNSGLPVMSEILVRLPATIELAMVSTIISLLIAIPLGIISARRQNSVVDYSCMVSAIIGVSMPNFWLGLLLILLFSLHLNLLPTAGYGSIEQLILPSITLGTGMAAITTRLTRSSMLEVLRQDYITTARAKGLSERVIIFRHTLRNALIPVITVVGLQLGHLLGGTVIVETIFAWPGIGKLLIDSIYMRDFPVIQGCVLFIAVIYSGINLLVDLSYPFLDPRIRYGGAE